MKEQVKINDLTIEYEIINRNVKYWRLEFKYNKLRLIIPKKSINHQKIIEKHKDWIYKKFREISKKKNAAKSLNLDNRSDAEFRDIVNRFIHKFSKELNVNLNKLYFKNMKSRWGSCSSRQNISINVKLKYLPEILIEYVVFHEMAHLVELNHSKNFWSIISPKFENYKDMEKVLSLYWYAIHELKSN